MIIGFDAKKIVNSITGIGNYSRGVVNSLSRYSEGNTLYLFAPKQIKQKMVDLLYAHDEMKFIYPTSFYCKSFLKEYWRCKAIVSDIRKLNIDIFHGLSNELPYNINKAGCKTVVTIHDLIFLRYPELYSMVSRRILEWKTKYACRVADKIIAVSEQTKKDIMRYYGIPEKKITVVYQGCNKIFYHSVSDTLVKRVMLKYKLPAKYILSVGTLEPRKNYKMAIKAMTKVDDDCHLVIAGKWTKYIKELEEYAISENISHRVHIISNISNEDLHVLYKKAEIFTYLSIFEGFGIPVLEALVCGTPIVAATGSCLEEAGGYDSLYCNPYDWNGIADSFNYLLNNKIVARKMVEKGYLYAQRFSEENIALNLIDVYREIISDC